MAISRRNFGTKAAAFQAGRQAVRAATALDENEEADFKRLETGTVLGKYAIFFVFGHLALGTAFFSYVEGWEFADSCYFCAITLSTVGFGDMAPSSDMSKIGAIVFILLGLSIVASSLGILVGTLQGLQEATLRTEEMHRTKRFIVQACMATSRIVIVVSVGATWVFFVEGWSVLDSIYWAVITASTVGYGDMELEQEASHYFNTIFVLVAAGAFALSLSRFGAIIMDIEAEWHTDAFLARGVSVGMLHDIKKNMDCDGNDSIDKLEFLEYMLVTMGKVSTEDIEKVTGMFDLLDEDKSGQLDAEDIRLFQRKRKASAAGGAPAPAVPMVAVEEPSATADAEMARGSWFGLSVLKTPLLGGK
jgi:potassium channel subfamily K